MAWRNGIENTLKANCTTFKELKNMIGRLIHLGTVLPQIHHFMSRMRELLRRAKRRRSVTLADAAVNDLKLIMYFLDKAAEGTDVNLLVYRKPTHIQAGLLSSWHRRMQQRWLCMEVLHT